jgi:hypothetical protein
VRVRVESALAGVSPVGARANARENKKQRKEMTVKTIIATALVAVGLLSAGATAQAAATAPAGSNFEDYPAWVQHAFEEKG